MSRDEDARHGGSRRGAGIDIDALIARITAEARDRSGKAFMLNGSFTEEPIVRRGSQMRTYLPDPIRRMRALGQEAPRRWSAERLFVEQARLMEDYEDDAPYNGQFMAYFPTYSMMSDEQLRGYFTWRAAVRRGDVRRTSPSFAYVYIYELLNGVGTVPGEKGFGDLVSFWRAFRAYAPTLDRYVVPWLEDYVAYHGLDPELLALYVDFSHDRAVLRLAAAEARVLSEPVRRGKRPPTDFAREDVADPALFDALAELSTYRAKASRLYKDCPEDLRLVCNAVFLRLVRYYQRGRSQSFVASAFGTRRAWAHLMFASSVFWQEGPHPDTVCKLDETVTYTCSGGFWTVDSLPRAGSGRSSRLGDALRATDRILRDGLGYPHPLKGHGEPKYLVSLIEREVSDYVAWKARNAAPKIQIDLSKLAGIRSGAARTCESLLVDEEREDAPEGAETAVAAGGASEAKAPGTGAPADGSAAAVPAAAPGGAAGGADSPGADGADSPGADDAASPETDGAASPFGLAPDELRLVGDLLAGRPLSAQGSWDLLADSVNEKLFDLLGDTALEFGDAGTPVLVEDYREDLLAALGDALS